MSDGLDFLLEPPPPPADTYRWATVTQLAPIRIQLDGDPAPVASEPVTLCPLRFGCRVWVQIHGRMMIILGVAEVPLPVEQLWAGSPANAIEATAWEPLTTGNLGTMSLDLPEPAEVELAVQGWVVSTNSADLRAGIAGTGATTFMPSTPGWGSVIWANGTSTYSHQRAVKRLVLNAGVTNLQLMMYKASAGVGAVNYPMVTARVLRWA